MAELIQILMAALILVASVFLVLGAIGLVRLPTLYMRLHAPTLTATLGLGGLLLAALLLAWLQGRLGLAEVIITLLVFLGAPLVSSVLAQAALHQDVPTSPPPPDELLRGLRER
ncbi:monovalent cation/H(+) antiporter subunit G [Amphibiibacter pelophylacis]|uniref:Monovalent cation/H(+) antiporter subunit G n=1 Tax=Amphibiibacter pelophylacis TaxID=1799477 RepID=A0ACC6P0G3_9BURK